jgi:hypothetical protein
MKTKILSPLFLFASLAMIYVTTSSSSTGNVASSGTSCGSCHGSKNTATTVNLTGLPASYVPGQSYTLTFTVANATNNYAGCNIAASAGTFTAGTGTQLMGSQITHTGPQTAVSGVTTFTCTWTAPTMPGTVNFNAAGNAVNGINGNDSGDQWNTTSISIGAVPASINDVQPIAAICYPNPANDVVIVKGITAEAKAIVLHNLYGQTIASAYTFENDVCKIDCKNLTPGLYFLSAVVNGQMIRASFTKN